VNVVAQSNFPRLESPTQRQPTARRVGELG
jgi:hypothetical protein